MWQTSTQEERTQIKQFWLGLTSAERGDLLRIDKEVVLKKIKEQSRHSCACAVCGRKRSAIEEEVERLYRAYEDQLERFARRQREVQQQQQQQVQQQQPAYPALGPGPFPGSVELDSTGAIIQPDELAPRRAMDGDAAGADLGEEDEDEYDDDEDEDDYDEDEEEDLVDDEIDDGGTDEADEGEDEYEDSPGAKHLAPSNHRAGTAAGGAHHHHHHHHHHAPKAADGRDVPQEQSDFYTFGDGLTTIKGKSRRARLVRGPAR